MSNKLKVSKCKHKWTPGDGDMGFPLECSKCGTLKKPAPTPKKERKIKPLDERLAKLFKKWIVQRPNGNCQILFALTELDDFIQEIIKKTNYK